MRFLFLADGSEGWLKVSEFDKKLYYFIERRHYNLRVCHTSGDCVALDIKL